MNLEVGEVWDRGRQCVRAFLSSTSGFLGASAKFDSHRGVTNCTEWEPDGDLADVPNPADPIYTPYYG